MSRPICVSVKCQPGHKLSIIKSTSVFVHNTTSTHNTSSPLMRLKRATANIPRRPRRNRIDRSQNVNLPRPTARQPQPSADKKNVCTCRTIEKRGLNRIIGERIQAIVRRHRVTFIYLNGHSTVSVHFLALRKNFLR